MKIKRMVAVILAACMLFGCASADEGQKSIFDAIGGWFGQAWEDASKWVSQAWEDASKWISQAWGDASKWVDQAWNDSSKWVEEIWGEASTWAAETFQNVSNSVSAWWQETFNQVTKTGENAVTLIEAQKKALAPENRELFQEMIDAISNTQDDAEEELHRTMLEFGKKLKIGEADAEKIWDTIKAYAAQKGMTTVQAVKLVLPYMYQLIENSRNQTGETVPAITVAQFLTGAIEKTLSEAGGNITETVNQLINTLKGDS